MTSICSDKENSPIGEPCS